MSAVPVEAIMRFPPEVRILVGCHGEGAWRRLPNRWLVQPHAVFEIFVHFIPFI